MLSACRTCCLNISQRCIFAFMAFMALCLVNMLRVILSIAITEMVAPIEEGAEYVDDTCVRVEKYVPKNLTVITGRVYDWNEYTQGLILSSYFWGYAVSQFPFGTLAERYGGKHFVGLGIFIPAVLTYLTPLAIDWGASTALIALRVVMGLVSGAVYPATNAMIPHWTAPAERTKFGTIILAGGIFGTVFGTTIPAIIIRYSGVGWPAAFYTFGTIGLLWFPLWILLCYNNPLEHPFISDSELKYLQQSLEGQKKKKIPAAPWTHILRSKQVWAFVLGVIGIDWLYFTMASDLPKYMSSVVKFSIEDNGYLSALPYLCTWIFSFIGSWVLNIVVENKCLTLTNARKIFGTVSLMGPALFLVGASYAECDKVLVVVLFVSGMTLWGIAFPSIMVNSMDLSPNYSGTIMALGNGLAAVGGIFAPYIVGLLTPNQTIGEWRVVFWIGFAVAVSCNLCFLLYASAEVQEWNDPDFERKKKKIVIIEEGIKKVLDEDGMRF